MTTDIDDDVDLPEDQKRAIEPIGRYGLAGRGLSVSLVGIYWVSAAINGQPSKAHELGGALQAVQQLPKGWLLLLILGLRSRHRHFSILSKLFYHRPRARMLHATKSYN